MTPVIGSDYIQIVGPIGAGGSGSDAEAVNPWTTQKGGQDFFQTLGESLCPHNSPVFVLKPSSGNKVAAVTATFPCGWIIPRASPRSMASRWPKLIGISALQNTFWHGRRAVLIPEPTSLQPASVATSGGIGVRSKHRSPTITARSYRPGCRGSGDMVRGSLRVPRLHLPDRVNDPIAIPA